MQVVQIKTSKGLDFVPDFISTNCHNSLKLKDLDFRVPCGKCLACQRKRRSDWSLRLEHEYLHSDSAYFITLTYNNTHLPRTKQGYPTLNKKHVQLYIKRLRNAQNRYVSKRLGCTIKEVLKYTRPLRYYAVGEYGSKTRRPHYHLLLFNLESEVTGSIGEEWRDANKYSLGFTDIGEVNGTTINYTTKYMFKPWMKKDKRVKPFSLMSKGRKQTEKKKAQGYPEYRILGFEYLKNYGTFHIEHETLETRDANGHYRRIPKAYVQRLFINKEDRLEISRKSYQEHVDKTYEKSMKIINKYYNSDTLQYMKSKKQQFKLKVDKINNTETL